jgi:hypothetical protein
MSVLKLPAAVGTIRDLHGWSWPTKSAASVIPESMSFSHQESKCSRRREPAP